MTAIEINDSFFHGAAAGNASEPSTHTDVGDYTVSSAGSVNAEAANDDLHHLPKLVSSAATSAKSATGNKKTKGELSCSTRLSISARGAKPTRALDDHLSAVFKLLHGSHCPDAATGLLVILNLHKTPVVRSPRGLTFGAGTAAERLIETTVDAAEFFLKQLVNKYHVIDPEAVQEAVRHQWTHYQPDGARSVLGKYYTPATVAKLVETLVEPLLDKMPEACVFEPAVGLGALLQPFAGHHYLGWDIDPTAVLAMNEMGFTNVKCGNSLSNVSRRKFGIKSSEQLIVVGNPPFNDTTSQHKRKSKTSGEAALPLCDADILSRDMGVSFLLGAAKLKPEAICMIHSLSFLIKEAKFKSLKGLSDHYKLEVGLVFSSEAFGLSGTPFPVVAALYTPGKMDYAYIEQFEFQIFNNERGTLLDTGKRLKLAKLETTHSFIRSTPPTKAMVKVSDIGIYQYNFRDANYVITSAAMTENSSDSSIPVSFDDLPKYAYVNCFKRYFGKDFVFGNITPLVRKADFANTDFVDACIYDAIMNNQHLQPMRRGNPASFIMTRGVIAAARRKAAIFSGAGINPHAAFVKFWDGKGDGKALSGFFVEYFKQLKAGSLVVSHFNVHGVMTAPDKRETFTSQSGKTTAEIRFAQVGGEWIAEYRYRFRCGGFQARILPLSIRSKARSSQQASVADAAQRLLADVALRCGDGSRLNTTQQKELAELRRWLNGLIKHLTSHLNAVAVPVVKGLARERSQFLIGQGAP